MAAKSRGATLTIFAILFALLAISNFRKPFGHDPNIGFVFLGEKLHGTANAVIGPLFGIILLVYAYGIWAMRKFALPIAYFYVPWVILNMILFAIRNPDQPRPSPLFAIGLLVIGIGVPLASAIILHRRRIELS
jgi:hypothetical protein